MPCAISSSAAPSSSSTSRVRACTTAAREVFAPSACRSRITNSTPAAARVTASARPVGPAPTITTSVRCGRSSCCPRLLLSWVVDVQRTVLAGARRDRRSGPSSECAGWPAAAMSSWSRAMRSRNQFFPAMWTASPNKAIQTSSVIRPHDDERQAEGVDRGEDVRCDSVPCGHGDLLAVGPVRLTEHGPRRPVVHRRRWREHLRIEGEPQAHDADGDQGPPSDPGVGPDRGDECRRARDAGVDAPRVGVSLPRAVAVEAECPGHSLFHRRHGPLRSRGAPTVGASVERSVAVLRVVAHHPGGNPPGWSRRDGHSTRVRSIEGGDLRRRCWQRGGHRSTAEEGLWIRSTDPIAPHRAVPARDPGQPTRGRDRGHRPPVRACRGRRRQEPDGAARAGSGTRPPCADC